MRCKKCSLRPICEIYKLKINYQDTISLNVSECHFIKEEEEAYKKAEDYKPSIGRNILDSILERAPKVSTSYANEALISPTATAAEPIIVCKKCKLIYPESEAYIMPDEEGYLCENCFESEE